VVVDYPFLFCVLLNKLCMTVDGKGDLVTLYCSELSLKFGFNFGEGLAWGLKEGIWQHIKEDVIRTSIPACRSSASSPTHFHSTKFRLRSS
jgi:hypothetical protein